MLMFSIFLTGCGETRSLFKVLPDSKTRSVSNMDQGSKEKPAGPSYENMRLVIDTVVDIFEEPDTHSTRITQVLYNQQLQLLEESESWAKVLLADHTEGWIKSKYLDRDCTSLLASNYKYRVVITAKTKKIYWGSVNKVALREAVMGTEFLAREKRDGGYEIALPQGETGWIDVSGTIQLGLMEQIPKTTGLDLITTTDKFRGTTYQLGGISGWGMDAAGLTFICAKINGVDLPRELAKQLEVGQEIQLEEAKPGDLIFFSSNEGAKDVSQVGVILEDGKFIHANKSKGAVMTNLMSESNYSKRIIGVRRVF